MWVRVPRVRVRVRVSQFYPKFTDLDLQSPIFEKNTRSMAVPDMTPEPYFSPFINEILIIVEFTHWQKEI